MVLFLSFPTYLEIFVYKAHVLEFVEDQPLALLGEATHLLAGHPLEEVAYGLSNPDCDDLGFLLHTAIIDACFHVSTVAIVSIIAKCLHSSIIATEASNSPYRKTASC